MRCWKARDGRSMTSGSLRLVYKIAVLRLGRLDYHFMTISLANLTAYRIATARSASMYVDENSLTYNKER